MKIATYRTEGKQFVGVVSDDSQSIQAFDVSPEVAALGALPLVQQHTENGTLPALSNTTHAVDSVELLAPIPQPRRNIFCVGRNYHEHAAELADSVFKDSKTDEKQWPIVFSKVPECVVGPFDNVIVPPTSVSDAIDYEAELAIIIGKGGVNISRENALEHIFGYTVVNDVTARDVQMRHKQWHLGKSFDTFCPMGPWIITADAFDGENARVQCWVNGELRQDNTTKNLIFDIPELIETCSRGIRLYPGDIIATGTPAGVGMGMEPPRYLKAGDVVRVEVQGLGHIENPFR